MDKKAIKKVIKEVEDMDFTNPATKPVVLGLIDTMFEMIVKLQDEVQVLKNEVNRLKGEKGKPNIKPNINTKPKMEKGDTSKVWNKKPKNVKIDRIEPIYIDRSILPEDATFKGYAERVIQNINITTDNVLYKCEVFYSKSENKTYTAELDESLKDTSFAPELKVWILKMYFEFRMTENLIHSFLTGIGISISEGQISNIIIKENADKFTEEKEEIFMTGMANSTSFNKDDSGFRENGKNKYITIICNTLFSYFVVNDNKKYITIESMYKDKNIDLKGKVLTVDDAPQFTKLLMYLAIQLCWVHEERHYKKLSPVLETHKEELNLKIAEIWDFYNELKEYKKYPNEAYKNILLKLFDDIFKCEVRYPALNKRLKLTYAKKDMLLTVLDYPEVDIHNNISENGIRPQVIKRNISGGTRTELGTIAWENHLSILSTCKKLGIDYYNYILEIFKGKKHDVSLSEMIKQKATA